MTRVRIARGGLWALIVAMLTVEGAVLVSSVLAPDLAIPMLYVAAGLGVLIIVWVVAWTEWR